MLETNCRNKGSFILCCTDPRSSRLRERDTEAEGLTDRESRDPESGSDPNLTKAL